MHKTSTVLLGGCLAALATCVADQAPPGSSASLRIESAGPSAIHARYSEGRQAIVLKSQLDGPW